jgi:SPP1 gp7 family putative phage head morphogenesis protein
MSHIRLQNVVKAMPHGKRLRKRQGRRLKPVKPSRKIELWYKTQLIAIVGQLRQVTRDALLPYLARNEPLYAKATDGLVRDRAIASETISAQIGAMKQKLGGIEGVAQRLAEAVTRQSLDSVDARLRDVVNISFGIDISGFLTRSGPIQEVVQAGTKLNVALIKSIPEQYFDKVGDAVTKGIESGLRYEDIAKEIQRVGDVTESRAKLIARDQVSKLNGSMSQVRQMSIGIDRYTWSTAGDERVREMHAELDGQEFSWTDSPPDGHPGEAVCCRCVAIPVINLDEDSEGYGFAQAAGTVAAAASIGAFFGSLADLD